MPRVEYEAPLAVVPDELALAYFGGYFAFGWLLWSRRGLIDAMARRPLAHAVAAVVLARASVRTGPAGRRDPGWTAEASVCLALLSWCAIFAAFGAGRRFLSQPRPWIRYLSDSFVLDLPDPRAPGDGPRRPAAATRQSIWLVGPVGGTVACGVLLIAYRAVVRHTVIGRTLHGPRPRGGRMDDMQRSSEGAEMPILRS